MSDISLNAFFWCITDIFHNKKVFERQPQQVSIKDSLIFIITTILNRNNFEVEINHVQW